MFISWLKNPCDEKEEEVFTCAPPFSYRNLLSLTSDTEEFKTKVEKARVSGNLDAPEGGFDAIMQALVCGEKIGWRKDARKLLMFSSDASFHFAGDGRLGGILEPHDGFCHLNKNGEYTHDGILDYPSIAQVNSKASEKSITIIFAVTADQLKDYERLSAQIQGSTAGELSKNSSNVVELVNHEYEKITSEVKLSHSLENGSPLKILLLSHCDGKIGEGGKCGGVKIGQTVNFTASLRLDTCPSERTSWSTSFRIRVQGIEEFLQVDAEFLCGCDCEVPENEGYEPLSSSCSNNGTLLCGACDCENGHFGKKCECGGVDDLINISVEDCRGPNGTAECSDRGECLCNVCDCHTLPINPKEKYYGKYCQCDDHSCRRVNGLLCSGNGKCDCGNCKCDIGWTNNDCSCSTSTLGCIGNDGVECNGRGRCECNRCICSSSEYTGPFCEECQDCPDKCTDMEACVLCRVHRHSSNETCINTCESFAAEIEIVEFAPSNAGKYCVGLDETDGCNFYFSYSYISSNDLIVKAQRGKSCYLLSGSGGWILGGSIVSLILVVGLLALLLLWYCREKAAKQEYAKFQEEKETARWDRAENPLYRNPNSTFMNPAFPS